MVFDISDTAAHSLFYPLYGSVYHSSTTAEDWFVNVVHFLANVGHSIDDEHAAGIAGQINPVILIDEHHHSDMLVL